VNRICLVNGLVFDGVHDTLRPANVHVAGAKIDMVGDDAPSPSDRVIDLKGRTLLPGLIDAHVHAYCAQVDIAHGDRLPLSAVSHRAAGMLGEALDRGFTCVRDVGGADVGLHLALERGWLRGPRLLYCGKALSQTGGHGDIRQRGLRDLCACGLGYSGHVSCTVDGVEPIRLMIREQFRQGASFVKIMGSGGASSTSDDLSASQYSDDEIRAAVDEAERHGAYVTAHVHPDAAIRRCIELGVHCLEHATMISRETAELAAARKRPLVPTLAVIHALAEHGASLGYPEISLERVRLLGETAYRGLEDMQRAGATIGFGTDLIGELHIYQANEFNLRRNVLSPFEILRSATSVNAEICHVGDHLGRVAAGYDADLIVVDGNPLETLDMFTRQGEQVRLVMKAGQVEKLTL
jgi:imidazolonepropionase-like amidohydrolase